MNYHPLTTEEAIQYSRRLTDLFPANASLNCREIGDGNLNLVFHVSDEKSGRSVIIKQALPYAKVVGESWPLTLDRARIESEALIAQGAICPTLVPKVYLYEPEMALTMMEDLSDHVIMRKGLMDCEYYPEFSQHISDFLASTLFSYSDLGMNQQEKKLLQGKFINPELCKITEDLIFDDPYTNSQNNNFEPHLQDAVQQIWSDTELHLEVARLRHGFLTKAQTLLHGDLHTGSIFITRKTTKVIDPEFAFFGPMGFDIGAVLANLILNYVGQEHWSESGEARSSYRSYLLKTIDEVWTLFEEKFRKLWDQQGKDRISATPGFQDIYMEQLLQDTIGYAGCKIVRRVIGLAHVADIDRIPEVEVRERAQRYALRIGTAWIKLHRQAKSIQQVIEIAEQAVTKGATINS